MKQNLKYVVGILLAAGLAFAGTIKVWGTNDVLTAADLNANFAHIHNLMVGGHGPRLVDADVAPGANIAYTKLGTNPYASSAWGLANTSSCTPDGGTCPVAGIGVTSVIQTADGVYSVTYITTPDVVMVQAGYPVEISCVSQQGVNPAVISCDTPPSTSIRIVAFNQ